MRDGWHIREANLFDKGALDAQMRAHNVILCDPPFEAFWLVISNVLLPRAAIHRPSLCSMLRWMHTRLRLALCCHPPSYLSGSLLNSVAALKSSMEL